jgi:TolB-like protein/Flp pilus assembly protein TadD
MSRPDMTETGATPGPEGSSLPDKKLVSWKEIAVFLGREIRTVQRWERTEGLPVHRHEHLKKSTVYAYASELDDWVKKRQPVDDPAADAAFVPEPDDEPASDTEESEAVNFGHAGAPSELARPEPAPPNEKRLGLLLATVVVLGIVVYGAYHWYQVHAMPQGKARLVVLPFKNLSGDASQNYLSEGLTDEITTQLGRLDPLHLGVIAPTSAKIMAGHAIKEIGKSLTVQYVLEGSVQRFANRAQINVQLIKTSDETPIWVDSFNRELSDFLQVESDVADTIARKMKATLPAPPAAASGGPPASPPVSTEALTKSRDAYLRGRFTWGSRGDLRSSIDLFQQAIELDPSYAQAYAGLAAATALIGQVPNDGMPPRDAKPKAKEAAQRALQLDPRLAEAHAVLGNVALSYDWDPETAEKELKLAIDLNPNYAGAHQWYAQLLLAKGRNTEALTEIHRALDLDPVSPLFHSVLAQAYYYGHRYDEAIAEAQDVVKLNPTYVIALYWLGSAYRGNKMYPQAIETFQRARQISQDNPAMLMAYGHAQAVAGNTKEARAMLHQLEQIQNSRYIPNLYAAAIHVGLKEPDEAIRLLSLDYQQKVDYLVYLGVEPMADPLRSDPRFTQLLSKIGLH